MRDETWIDKLIREKTESGELAPSEGVGEPIKNLNRPYDPLWWVRSWVEREQLDDIERDAKGPRDRK